MSQNTPNTKKRDKSATSSRQRDQGRHREEVDQSAEEFVDFLQNSEGKKAVKEFIIDAYKRFESEKLQRVKNQMKNEEEVNQRGATPFHKPGNITHAMDREFNMTEVEDGFVRGLRGTRENLLRSVEDRVEEINRLLADMGGFSSQLKSCFARSTVVFLEQEDPKHNFRERLIFSINLPNFELKRPWDKKSDGQGGDLSETSDARSSMQVTWDEAVNALAKIVETTGLKPKYCKNDRHFGRFVMKQDLRSKVNMPDEYFSFTLDYNTSEKIEEMALVFNKIVDDYEAKLKKLSAKIKGYPENSKAPSLIKFKKEHLAVTQERDYFIGTTPDPNQLDEGLLFLIEVSSLKDYHIVKDRMQSIMTRYILYLSKIAAKEAEFDPELKYQLSKAGPRYNKKIDSDSEKVTIDDLRSVPQYTIQAGTLKPLAPKLSTVKKKKAA